MSEQTDGKWKEDHLGRFVIVLEISNEKLEKFTKRKDKEIAIEYKINQRLKKTNYLAGFHFHFHLTFNN